MPVLTILLVLVQIAFAVHVVQTDKACFGFTSYYLYQQLDAWSILLLKFYLK